VSKGEVHLVIYRNEKSNKDTIAESIKSAIQAAYCTACRLMGAFAPVYSNTRYTPTRTYRCSTHRCMYRYKNFVSLGVLLTAKNPPHLQKSSLISDKQLAMRTSSSTSWATYVKNDTTRYELLSACELFMNPPRNQEWKSVVKQAVFKYWTNELQCKANRIRTSSLRFLNIQNCVNWVITRHMV